VGERAGSDGSGSTELTNRTRLNDEAHHGRQEQTSAGSRAPVVVRVDGGFDWPSAGVGAAGGLGAVLVAGVAASAMRRRHGTAQV
jgi:hypothetical protein